MIDDMASLKHAMEQMDSDDAAVASAARDRAAQILSNARLSFAKIAELIEERRLLLRPRIVASIKRMDQPDGLGDSAFRDTGASLRKEGQSFRQIAEALELGGPVAPRYEKAAHSGLHQVEFHQNERDLPESPKDPALVSYLLRFLVITGLAVALVYGLYEFAAGSWHLPGYRAGLGSVRQRADVTQPGSPGEPALSASPSAGPTPPSAAGTAAPSANESTPATPAPAAPANPPAANLPPPSAPSMPAANERPRTAQSRTYNDFMPDRIRRKSRYAGPCMGGVGGCYWGGGQY